MQKYIEIGHSWISNENNRAKLNCDISIDGNIKTIFFSVESKYKDNLTKNRADPFLTLLINYAMVTNRNIICRDPVDEYLLFGIRNLYIKTLTFGNKDFHLIEIEAETINDGYQNEQKIGAAMSFGCDSMYTFYKHRNDGEYAISHLCVFNNGVYPEDKSFEKQCLMVKEYAEHHHKEFISVDSNIQKILPERFLDVYSQRNLACVLALQGLFKVYLYSAGHDDDHISINPHNAASYDLITVEAFSTKNLLFILSGCEKSRVEKLKTLSDFEDTYHYLHPCFKAPVSEKNCGHCQKDIREMVLFYAWGKQKDFEEIYDWTDFEKRLPMCLGILIALSNEHLYKEVLDEYLKAGYSIPPQSYRYAKVYQNVLKRRLE